MISVARKPFTRYRTTITAFNNPMPVEAAIATGTPTTGERLPDSPAATIPLSAVFAMIEKSAAPVAGAKVLPIARTPNQEDESRMLTTVAEDQNSGLPIEKIT